MIYQDFDGTTESKTTEIRLRECEESDIGRKDWMVKTWNQLDWYKPYYCFDNTEDIYFQGGSTTYDNRAYLSVLFSTCKDADYCEKDPVKVTEFLRSFRILTWIFEDQIDF